MGKKMQYDIKKLFIQNFFPSTAPPPPQPPLTKHTHHVKNRLGFILCCFLAWYYNLTTPISPKRFLTTPDFPSIHLSVCPFTNYDFCAVLKPDRLFIMKLDNWIGDIAEIIYDPLSSFNQKFGCFRCSCC